MLTPQQTDAYKRIHDFVTAHKDMLDRMSQAMYVRHIAPGVIETPSWHMCEALLNLARMLLRHDQATGQDKPAFDYIVAHGGVPDRLVIQEAQDLLAVDEEILQHVA